jgi:serine/threonine-protein kinase
MLVEEEGDPDFVKILDFGVAKLTHDQQTHGLTQAGALLGTLAFMAPEQISGKDVDARTDIYSLGIILYRMFTGVTVWDADSLSDIVRHQLSSRPPSMAERITNPQFTAAHDDVVLRCLEKDPAARFQSMRELAAALLAAEQAPRTAPGAVVAEFRAPTTTPASPTHERQAEGLEATRTSPATSPTGAGRAWTAALPGASSSTATTLNDDDGVFADGDGDAPTLAATMAPTLPTVPAPARELAPAPARGAGPVVTAATTTTTTPTTPTTPPTAPRSRGVVVGLVAAAAVGGVILALVLGRAPTAAAPATSTPPPVTPTPPQVTATPAPATMTPPPASTSPPPVTTTPEPAPATTPPPPPPTTTTTTTPPAAPKPAPPTRPAVTTKPPPPKPAPAPEPASGFKRVHTRGTP